MNYHKACEILEIMPNSNFSLKDLKKKYYKKALIFHPDKNNNSDQAEFFKEINDAYTFLQETDPKNNNEHTYESLLNHFIRFIINDDSIITNIQLIINDCHRLSLETFKSLNKNSALKIYNIIEKHVKLFHISEEIMENLREIMQEKMKNDELIILNPTLKNLFQKELYKLEINNEIHYVPLWHDEIIYDLSNTTIVKCFPKLPKHILIDDNNNIHIYIKSKIIDLLNKEFFSVTLYLDKNIEISVNDIKIKKNQIILLKNKGIPQICINNLFDDSKLSNIYIHLQLI
mgnify:CR=1 FL=1|tara:strand:+ start:976 stop:1839 length:864 start_codon:yes stop_codon:yes gene_type:complete